MVINQQAARTCASCGANLRNKLRLGLFGAVATTLNSDSSCRLRRLAPMVPNMWLRPERLNGLEILVDPADWSQTVIFDEIFLRGSYDLREVSFQPSHIIDCGAHIGMFSLLAKAAFPSASVVAIEPNRKNAWFMRQQISRNDLDIRLVEAAVSTRVQVLEFVAINSHGGRLVGPDNDSNRFANGAPTYMVEAVDLAAEIERIKPESLLLKMDIEGEERDVLPAILPGFPKQVALFFETHFGTTGWHEMETLLSSNEFRVRKLNERGPYCDGFASRA